MSIRIPVLLDYDGKGAKAAETSLKKLAAGAGVAALSWQTLGRFAVEANKAFIEDEKSQRLLADAIRNNTSLNEKQIKQQEDFIQSTQDQTKVLDDKLRPAYATLIRYTKSASAAQNLLNGAMDIAAGTGKDLETVSVAIGKAYAGNFTALKRLGVPIDDSIIKSKDFEAAWRNLTGAFDGSQASITKAEGALGDMRVQLEDFKEQAGGLISKVSKPFLEIGAAALEMSNYIIDGITATYPKINKLEDSLRTAAQAAKDRSFEEQMMTKWLQIKADADKKAAEAAARAAAAAREAAKANKERLGEALDAAKRKLDAVTASMDQYAGSIRDAVSGYLSLSNAVQMQSDTEDAYNAALEDRRQAYEELAKLQTTVFDVATGKTTVADAQDLAAAMERVAKAEGAVSKAQGERKTYTQAFAEQIAAARNFATDLKTLIDQGLQAPGVQQLLNLGPVAGAAVAKDLLAGTAGLTVNGLNASLNEIAGLGIAAGNASAGQVYGADLLSAQQGVSAVGQAQQMNITIQATSADPDKIVAALVAWSKKNGKLPSVVKVS